MSDKGQRDTGTAMRTPGSVRGVLPGNGRGGTGGKGRNRRQVMSDMQNE